MSFIHCITGLTDGRGVKLVSLLGGEKIDGSVSCNKEAWINEQSKLSDMVSWSLV